MICPYCLSSSLKKTGFYFRTSDQTLIQRYFCKHCKHSSSQATKSSENRQKKRHLNSQVFELLVSGVSLRRAAKLLKINRKTVVRKLTYWGKRSLQEIQDRAHLVPAKEPFYTLSSPSKNSHTQHSNSPRATHSSISQVQFDDMETFEHTKLKPLSITLVVEKGSRKILDFAVASMPAKGLLFEKSVKKYGLRKDERKVERKKLFRRLKDIISPQACFESDSNPHYPKDLKRAFPNCTHLTSEGRRGCVVGQGELKAGGYDPLFSLNHTAAMIRANLNRLFRRTWCTTKKPIFLTYHLAMYVIYHNQVLTQECLRI